MKRITLFLCALALSAMSFAQTVCLTPVNIVRNNGVACGGAFGGAEIFITFFAPSCIVTPPTLTFTENGAPISTTVNEGEFLSCTAVSGGFNILFRYCTADNIAPANNLCVQITGCPIILCEDAGGPTPVTLSNFVAARSGNNVNMKWATSTEINSKEFIIQKKVGTNWVDYATVASANRANGSTYSYTDVNNTAKGITEYRLKMVDFGGAFKLSDIRPIKGLSGASDFTVYPNPSNGTAFVALSESFDKSTVQLLDNAGRILKTETLQASGSTSFKSLTPGYYLIRVKNNVTGEVVTQKLSVIK